MRLTHMCGCCERETHGYEAKQFRCSGQDLHHPCASKPVQYHILEVLDSGLQLVVHFFQAASVWISLLDQVFSSVEVLRSLPIFDVPLLG